MPLSCRAENQPSLASSMARIVSRSGRASLMATTLPMAANAAKTMCEPTFLPFSMSAMVCLRVPTAVATSSWLLPSARRSSLSMRPKVWLSCARRILSISPPSPASECSYHRTFLLFCPSNVLYIKHFPGMSALGSKRLTPLSRQAVQAPAQPRPGHPGWHPDRADGAAGKQPAMPRSRPPVRQPHETRHQRRRDKAKVQMLQPLVINHQAAGIEQKSADHILPAVQRQGRKGQHRAPAAIGLPHGCGTLLMGGQRSDAGASGLLDHEPYVRLLIATPAHHAGGDQIGVFEHGRLAPAPIGHPHPPHFSPPPPAPPGGGDEGGGGAQGRLARPESGRRKRKYSGAPTIGRW